MANKTISQLNNFPTAPGNNDLLVFVENASLSTYKITYGTFASTLNADISNVTTTVRNNSASWEESAFITPLQNASGSWDSVYSSVNAISSNVVSVYTSMSQTSSNWNNTYTDFSTNSSSYVKSNHTGNVTIAGTLSATALDLNQLTALSSVPVQGTRTLTTLFLSITVGTSSLYIPLYQ